MLLLSIAINNVYKYLVGKNYETHNPKERVTLRTNYNTKYY